MTTIKSGKMVKFRQSQENSAFPAEAAEETAQIGQPSLHRTGLCAGLGAVLLYRFGTAGRILGSTVYHCPHRSSGSAFHCRIPAADGRGDFRFHTGEPESVGKIRAEAPGALGLHRGSRSVYAAVRCRIGQPELQSLYLFPFLRRCRHEKSKTT